MRNWRIAGVQMDCRLGAPQANLETIRSKLRASAAQGAQLIVFPECALTGYCFDSKEEAWPHAEPLPGPSSEVLAADCRALNVWTVVGLLERDGDRLFNACALIGPTGLAATYRKIHLPFLGVDRFTTPGDRPFAVHDLGGLRIGINICYDGGFPESARTLMLLGADVVILPTNWPTGARGSAKYLSQARALENLVYYVAVNRVGAEGGFHFIGWSRIVDPFGELLATGGDGEEVLLAEVDPARARNKHIVNVPGAYELHRTRDRRPEMYGPICERS